MCSLCLENHFTRSGGTEKASINSLSRNLKFNHHLEEIAIPCIEYISNSAGISYSVPEKLTVGTLKSESYTTQTDLRDSEGQCLLV